MSSGDMFLTAVGIGILIFLVLVVILFKSTWRIAEPDEDFAKDLAQAVLVSHIDMITAVLDFVGVPHENGFFAKNMDPKPYFSEGWEERVFEKFRLTFPEPLILFYINHLRWELLGAAEPWHPAPGNVS